LPAIIYQVECPVAADPKLVTLSARELYGVRGARVLGEEVYRCVQPLLRIRR
jgi:hypothetical protein